MRRSLATLLIFVLAGCSSSHHDREVETPTHATVEHPAHEHHGHQAANDCQSDNIGQDIVEDAESGLISIFFQLIFDAIFHRDEDD